MDYSGTALVDNFSHLVIIIRPGHHLYPGIDLIQAVCFGKIVQKRQNPALPPKLFTTCVCTLFSTYPIDFEVNIEDLKIFFIGKEFVLSYEL